VNKTLGIILIALGLFGLAWGGFTYTTREKVVDIGPIHATREKTHNVPLPPIAGAVALIGGVVLLVARKEGVGFPQSAASYRSQERKIPNVDTHYQFVVSFDGSTTRSDHDAR
jgi:hypothetical protein